MRYALYARKSSVDETNQIQSIDDQVRILREIAARRGLAVAVELTESQSAKKPGIRPVFQKLLGLLRSGQADAILVWHLNRLSRNMKESGDLGQMLQDGVIQEIVTPERTYRPEDNIILFSVESGMANQYILDLSKAVKRGIQSKIEKGWCPQRAPEGYKNNKDNNTIETDPERFELIRKAWDLLLTGTYTAPEILRKLNGEWGYRTKPMKRTGNNPMGRTSLYNLFGSIFYTGHFMHNGEILSGRHKPMVTMAEFLRAQEILDRQGKHHPQKRDLAFTNLIRCARCGAMVCGEVKRNRAKEEAYVYYHCTGSRGCKKTSLRQERIEAQINEALQKVTLHPRVYEVCLQVIDAWFDEDKEQQETILGQHHKAIEDLKRQQDALLSAYLKKIVEEDEYVAKKADLREQLNKLQMEGELLNARSETTREAIENAIHFAGQARQHYLKGNPAMKRMIAHTLGASFLLDDGKLRMEIDPLLVPIYQNTAEIGAFETAKAGSPSTKGTDILESVPLGWAKRTIFETMLEVVQVQNVAHFPFLPFFECGHFSTETGSPAGGESKDEL